MLSATSIGALYHAYFRPIGHRLVCVGVRHDQLELAIHDVFVVLLGDPDRREESFCDALIADVTDQIAAKYIDADGGPVPVDSISDPGSTAHGPAPDPHSLSKIRTRVWTRLSVGLRVPPERSKRRPRRPTLIATTAAFTASAVGGLLSLLLSAGQASASPEPQPPAPPVPEETETSPWLAWPSLPPPPSRSDRFAEVPLGTTKRGHRLDRAVPLSWSPPPAKSR